MGLVINRMAYLPPSPSYQENRGRVRWFVDAAKFDSVAEDFQYIKTTSGRKIATLHVCRKQATQTIIYSHGNAEDLGFVRPLLVNLANYSQVNVFCYDYGGYGLSEGSPNESNTYDDIEAVYEYVLNVLKINPKDIILLGRSIGSGPTCECALRHHQEIGGFVVQSGLTSAIRVVKDLKGIESPIDIYKNYKKVPRITCPLYVIHGVDDTVIASSHGRTLAETASRLWRCWLIEGAGHNDIESRYGMSYYANIASFLHHVRIVYHRNRHTA